MNENTFWSMLGILIIPFFIYLWRIYLKGGRLTIEIVPDGGIGSPKGIVNAFLNNDDERSIDSRKSIHLYRLTYRFEIVITNNSESTVFFPKLKFKNDINPFSKIEPLKELTPIESKKSQILKAEYSENDISLPENRKRLINYPIAFDNLELLLEYKNDYKAKFYTLYTHSTKTNTFPKMKPKF